MTPSTLPLVLIADDEPDIRSFLCTAVARLGGQPVAMADGASAIAAIANQPQAFAVALLDQQMPQCTGTEAAVAIRALAPALPIILSSGGLGDEEHDILGHLPLTTLLHKPYALKDLRAMLVPSLVQVA
jgi:CheY-like chemotaxis protein